SSRPRRRLRRTSRSQVIHCHTADSRTNPPILSFPVDPLECQLIICYGGLTSVDHREDAMDAGEGGDSNRMALWADTEQPIPLLASSRPSPADEPAESNGDRATARDRDHPEPPQTFGGTAAEFSPERMLRIPSQPPGSGWRGTVFRLSGGIVRLGPSREELRQRELIAQVKTPIRGCRKVAFISRKGGVGKTSTCLLAGHTFAMYRGDRVVALDGNPDAGTLGHRIRRETSATVTRLLDAPSASSGTRTSAPTRRRPRPGWRWSPPTTTRR